MTHQPINNEDLIQALSPRPAESPVVKHLDTILIMLTNDIQEIKDSIKAHQLDTREEFRRVRDKMDDLNRQFTEDSKSSAVNMKEIETRQQESARFAGRIAGAISGFVTALVVSVIAVMVRVWLIGQQ